MKIGRNACPVTKTAVLLSDVHTMLITREILTGPKRFCEIERSLEGISTRTLAAKLKQLEKDSIVRKTKEGMYAATKKGAALRIVEKAMRKYGEMYL
jgi:DNA-binding HxlR family transcriptional regulator